MIDSKNTQDIKRLFFILNLKDMFTLDSFFLCKILIRFAVLIRPNDSSPAWEQVLFFILNKPSKGICMSGHPVLGIPVKIYIFKRYFIH